MPAIVDDARVGRRASPSSPPRTLLGPFSDPSRTLLRPFSDLSRTLLGPFSDRLGALIGPQVCHAAIIARELGIPAVVGT
eukprot:7518654-Pyramimonas_sp.AAC.1